MSQLLRARRILTEQGWLDDHQLRIESGAVAAIEPIPAAPARRSWAVIWKDRTLRPRTKGRIRPSCSGSWISPSWTG